MRLCIAPLVRSRRAVQNDGPHLSVAYDITGFRMICLKNAGIKLSRVPSIRSRREVWNGGPHLSVAYDLTCFVALFGLHKLCLKNA